MTDGKGKFCLTDAKGIITKYLLDIEKLLKQTYWAKERDLKTIETSIKYSKCFAIIDTEYDVLVGFARAITDYATMYYLTDVVVDEVYRGQGLGKWMLNWILNEEVSLKGDGLLKTGNAQELYSNLGFEACQSSYMWKPEKR